MQVILSTDANAALDDPDNFRAFSVAVPAQVEKTDLAALVQHSGVGELDPDGAHVHVSIDAIRALAAGRTAPAWNENFAAMIAFARTKGWVDDARSTVRAHLETR